MRAAARLGPAEARLRESSATPLHGERCDVSALPRSGDRKFEFRCLKGAAALTAPVRPPQTRSVLPQVTELTFDKLLVIATGLAPEFSFFWYSSLANPRPSPVEPTLEFSRTGEAVLKRPGLAHQGQRYQRQTWLFSPEPFTANTVRPRTASEKSHCGKGVQ